MMIRSFLQSGFESEITFIKKNSASKIKKVKNVLYTDRPQLSNGRKSFKNIKMQKRHLYKFLS